MQTDEERLQHAIDTLITEVQANKSGAEEAAALKGLISQLRNANQNLVLAAVKAQVLQEEAEIRNQRQNEFLAMLAHELRNPMAPISNAAKVLEKIVSAHPLLPQIQGIIHRQVEHMARLLDDLLDASRVTTGKVHLQLSTIALNEVISRSVELTRPFIEKRHQQLEIEPLAETALIEGDIIRLSQALSNLLINASKFTQERGHISVKARRQANTVIVSVKDNGIGIAPDLQTHIFELFAQGPRSLDRSEGGLGIGLSVSRSLVEMHDGRITVNSAGLGLGSEFEIHLPVSNVAAPELPIPSPSLKKLGGSGTTGRRILLIEDNADTNATLQMLLEIEGHEVETALDGLTGLSMAKANLYDVIICDIGLPGIDGYEIMAQIRQQTDKPQPFAIALSGYGQPEDRDRAIEVGFDHHVVKPVKGDYLLRLVTTRVTAV